MADLQKKKRERGDDSAAACRTKGDNGERVTQAALGRRTTLPACLSLAKHMVLVTTVAATRNGYPAPYTHIHTLLSLWPTQVVS